MQFEFDEKKSESNLDKHGIDFVEAQDLWADVYMVQARLDYGGERRWAAIARLADGLWTAVYTMRGQRVRLISVRRATPKEVALYDRHNNDR